MYVGNSGLTLLHILHLIVIIGHGIAAFSRFVTSYLVGCIGCNSMKAYCLTGATPSHFLASASACDEAAALAPALQASGLPLASVVLVVEGSVRSHCANLQRGICS